MDQARKLKSEPDGDDAVTRLRLRGEAPAAMGEFDKVLRFSPPARDQEQDSSRERSGGFTGRDIKTAIDLVHDAAKTIKAAEDRAREGEARTQALLARATEELKSAEARVQAAEARARAAESRTQDAETRLREAETWLRQVFSAIADELPVRR